MSKITSIQWCDSTVNPVMGCGGCELYLNPKKIMKKITEAINRSCPGTSANLASLTELYKALISNVYAAKEYSHPGHTGRLTTTNIWHLQDSFAQLVSELYGKSASEAARDAISRSVTCYAAILHLNKTSHILDRTGNRNGKNVPRKINSGYATTFENVTAFPGRMAVAAAYPDLLGTSHPATPWKNGLPRMIFVSDMGDAFSRASDFTYLRNEVIPAITSDNGRRHLWCWLTKRPEVMRTFAQSIGGFPDNVCAMTTLTCGDSENMQRLESLRKVPAKIRGLSIEPLRERLPASELDLSGIDWVIVGGESGSGLRLTSEFKIEWAEELRRHCADHGVSFFLKQLGRNPVKMGQRISLSNAHGGDWLEWEECLRVREFPKAFHAYRSGDRLGFNMLDRPIP